MTERVPGPAEPTPPDDLPHPLCFCLTEGQRRAVLEKLRRFRKSRAASLLAALGIEDTER